MRGIERILYALAAFVVIVAGIRAAASIVIPFLLAVFITIIITPVYLAMRRRGISNFTSLAVLLLALSAIGFGGANLIGASIQQFTRHLPDYQQTLVKQRDQFVQWLEQKGIDTKKLGVEEGLDPRFLLRYAGSMAAGLSGLIGQGFIVLLIVIFMLLEVSILPQKLRQLPYFTPERWRQLSQAVHNVRRYMGIKTAMSVLTGVGIGLWCWLLGLDQVLLLGLLAFLLNYIPTIGSIVAALPALLIALTKYGMARMALCAIGYTVINIAISNFLEPRLMGRRLGLSPLVVIVSIFFWGWVLGAAGMLLSVPLTMALKIALQNDPTLGWIALILGRSSDAPEGLPEGEKVGMEEGVEAYVSAQRHTTKS